MIGIVLIAHARVASESKKTVEHVLGEQSFLIAIDVENSDDIDNSLARMKLAIKQCTTDVGVLVFADMLGGTPCNIAQSSATDDRCEVISGFNIPTLIKAVSERATAKDVKVFAKDVVATGKQYMCVTSEFMTATPDGSVHG
ncbi:MAG: PTS sugar transporter subunit IIA [Mariprofundaceae bacterium]|nr:PTS sugar transporter subunit IIA [Mariprofundaceae bacterium]